LSKAKSNPATTGVYDASSLQVLEGLDAVRKRPGMYIGSTDSRGLQHCMWEIIDNAVDEALAGHCDEITVTLFSDSSVQVEDNGRGIPTDIEKKTGLSGVEVVFTKLHAGGKFGGGGYSASGGLHGVGASVVNALSSKIEVSVRRNQEAFSLCFDHGVAGHYDATDKFKPGKIKSTGKIARNIQGTTVRYWPDRKIFLDTAEIDLELTFDRARQTAFLVPGLKITVTDLRNDEPVETVFEFEGGMKDFVEYTAKDTPIANTLHFTGEGSYEESIPVLRNDILVTENVKRHCKVEVALHYGNGYDTELKSYVNIIATPKGGTHVQGFERALTKNINEGLKNLKILKNNEDGILKEDAMEGLTAIVLVRLEEPQFEGQTKEVLGTSAINGIVFNVVQDGLKSFFNDPREKNQAKIVAEKIANAMRARIAARAQRETVRRKNALESSSLPAKLADCRSDDMQLTELFIVEGDSAAGTVRGARDSEFQAFMPIRGKILNTMRASEKQMLDNAECASIISAIGAGSGESFDITNIRYGKLIVLSDADVDGAHIRCLLLTLCFRYMLPILENGHVYAAVPPLYRIEVSGSKDHIYCYSDEERDENLARIEKQGKKVKELQRYKGLGEMDADQLAETTMELSHRKLRRMTVTDGALAEKMFHVLMGDDVPSRRDFIVERGGLLDPQKIDT
jgi:DNA gyrase subunit B